MEAKLRIIDALKLLQSHIRIPMNSQEIIFIKYVEAAFEDYRNNKTEKIIPVKFSTKRKTLAEQITIQEK